MAQVRLKHNVIVGGKLLARGEVVDEEILTPLLRSDQYVTRDLDPREGKVMMLINVTYTTEQVDPLTKLLVGYPCSLAIGELCDLEEIPERQRQGWQEGVEYKSDWTEQQRLALRATEDEKYLKQFQPEKVRTYGA